MQPVARIYLLGFIPLQSRKHSLSLFDSDYKFPRAEMRDTPLATHENTWWEGFRGMKRWVQVMILLGVFSLKVER